MSLKSLADPGSESLKGTFNARHTKSVCRRGDSDQAGENMLQDCSFDTRRSGKTGIGKV